jgi:tight adherence protein B
MSGVILSLLPVFLGITIYLLNREYMILLFTTTTGLFMVVFAIISELIGILLIKKIINIDM